MVCRFVHHSRVIFISIYDFLSTKGKKIMYNYTQEKKNKRTLSHKQVYIYENFFESYRTISCF
ncbi:CEI_1a_G0054510.mRNA.1.CDS.1 [Saccharomyces cerevisiae]|nr:EM14S01-3B_G0018890.mRNA.1.CDS.1 [Saccharomyces cerevisiae]CAI4836584.1 CEI_1a_G0054510.mRNA.1.CDS.1 [Saccharomyces cerevisiae]CAI4842875.1 AMH_1a_G0054640.mRNA.1.CDS.1 [Saccharomyces cerevisiae]CAI6905497.1 AMH_1a_G0054640.mRNA.1.CDS.1 [Saccharomyces cerevisiae]CAI7480587.1 CEI_1a_G0054510.mRNA.1.CDS.1 [Saccharomyces cerevisiae]